MTVQTVILPPPGIVGLGPCIGVTGITGILLMTHQTSGSIPLGLHAVGFQPPQVIVRGRHRNLMAFPT
ncbi:MAG: hypothetical protein WCO42_02570 [bacterium]